MRRLRDRLAIAIAAAAFVLGVRALALARFDVDVHLAQGAGGRVFVDSVDRPEQRPGARGSDPAWSCSGSTASRLIELPSLRLRGRRTDAGSGDGRGRRPRRRSASSRVLPLDAPIDPAALRQLLAAPITNLEAIQPWDLRARRAGPVPHRLRVRRLLHRRPRFDAAGGLPRDRAPAARWLVARQRPSRHRHSGRSPSRSSSRPRSRSSCVRPVRPSIRSSSPSAASLTVLAMLPLASALVERIADPEERRVVAHRERRVRHDRDRPRRGRRGGGIVAGRRHGPGALGAHRGDPADPGAGGGRADPAGLRPTVERPTPRIDRISRSPGPRRSSRSRPAPRHICCPLGLWVGLRPRRWPVHGPPARPPRDARRRSSATSSSPRPRRNGRASPPTSTTTRSRS